MYDFSLKFQVFIANNGNLVTAADAMPQWAEFSSFLCPDTRPR
jgi:hypothetical protein